MRQYRTVEFKKTLKGLTKKQKETLNKIWYTGYPISFQRIHGPIFTGKHNAVAAIKRLLALSLIKENPRNPRTYVKGDFEVINKETMGVPYSDIQTKLLEVMQR